MPAHRRERGDSTVHNRDEGQGARLRSYGTLANFTIGDMAISREIKETALIGMRYRRDEISAQIRELEQELGGSRDNPN
jgi:hypothetical protein